MSDVNPQWTAELTEKFVPGEDQLGVEGAAQSYQQWLIPGIITTTDRARYYSIYAWILHRFINAPGSSRLLKDFRGAFYKRHEMALILGSYSHHRNREFINGLVGSGTNNSKVRRWWDLDDPVSLDIKYFNNLLGGFGQYYLTAMQALGIIGASEHPSWVYRLTPRGQDLALAYQESITHTTYAQNLCRDVQVTSLSHADAIEYGAQGCLCPEVLAEGRDLPLLREAFFRFDQEGEDNPHVRRRLALSVILDIVRGADGKFQREMLRPALYLGQYQSGMMFQPSLEIQNWVSRWKLVEIRHLYTFGLQCLWASFLLNLREHSTGLSIPEFEEWLKQTLGIERFNLPLTDFLDELCIEIGLNEGWDKSSPVFNQACSLETNKDEYTNFLRASEVAKKPDDLLIHGVMILAQLYLRFRGYYLDNDPLWLEMAERQRLPLTGYFDFMKDAAHRINNSVGAWLLHLYREMIWGQHEFMALEKLRYQDYDTFKFSYRDGKFYWPFRTPDAYQEPIRLAANRLFNALTILTDLGLVNKDQEEIYSLTADGEKHLMHTLEACYNGH